MDRFGARVAVWALALAAAGCGGGGGGGSSEDPDVSSDVLDPAVDFFLTGAAFARPIVGVDGELSALVNPASLYEVDPLTGVALPGFPKVLNAGASLGATAPLNFAQILDPLTPQIPVIPRNAALVLEFSQVVDATTLGLSAEGDGDDLLITSSSTIQVRRKDGTLVPARAYAQGKKVAILGVTSSTLGFEPSPLVFDSTGKLIQDAQGHLRVVVGVGAGSLSSSGAVTLVPRLDKLGSPARPLPFNPGNGLLDAIVLQTETGPVGFNGFLPDLSPPRVVRPVTLAGVISTIGSFGGDVRLDDANLASLPNTTAQGGAGEWANALLEISSPGGLLSKYVVAKNFNTGSVASFVLAAGEVLDPAVDVGDTYVLARAEFFEPIPPPLPIDPLQLARVTVDPANVPRDPNDPQDLLNSDLRYFTRMFAQNGDERIDRWNPATGTFLPVPHKTQLRLQFSEPMDVASFRPYESFFVTDAGLPKTDPAFRSQFPGRVVGSVDGRTLFFRPELVDQIDPAGTAFVGFGGTASVKRLVLRTIPSQADLTALLTSATPDVLAQLVDLPTTGILGCTDLGGRGLGLPAALLDQGDPVNFVLASSSPSRGAFPPAPDFALEFETLSSSDPDHGVIVHRFLGQATTSIFNYPAGSVHDTVTAGVEYNDYPPEDTNGDGIPERRFIYGPKVVEVGLNLPGRLTGAPAVFIEHLIDNFNPPKPATFSNPNGEDFLVSLGFGAGVPITSGWGARFQHIYRAGDASPSKQDFEGVPLDLVALAWSPFPGTNGNISDTTIDDMEILVGLSGINRGRGPNTNQTNGIPTDEDSGLVQQFDCNALEWNDNCCNAALTTELQKVFDANEWTPLTTVVAPGTPYPIKTSNLFKPLSAGASTSFNPYLLFPAFNAGVDPAFGKSNVFSYPYRSDFSMLIEYRIKPNHGGNLPTVNLFRFSPGILTSVLPRFRVWSQGQDPFAHCVPNWSIAITPPIGNQPGFFFGGEGGPLLEPGTFTSEVKPPPLHNGMPTIPIGPYILPPRDPNFACPNRPRLQPLPDAMAGEVDINTNSPTNGCITRFPKCNTQPAMNWYYANGMLMYNLPDTLSYPGSTGFPPTFWRGYGVPLGAVIGTPGAFPNQPPCIIPLHLGLSNNPNVVANEPGMTPPPQRFGDNARYYMLWRYQKRVSIVESPTLAVDTGEVTYLRPIIEPPLTEVSGGAGLRLEVRAGPQLDFAVQQLASPYVDVVSAAFSDLVSGEDKDHVFVKFRATFGTAPGSTQPPSFDTVILPYRKASP